MKVAIGCDHGALDLKNAVIAHLEKKGFEIKGLEEAAKTGAIVFHCGTKADGDKVLTAGGRVLSVTGTGATLREAVDKAYAAIGCISFDKMFYRKDIAHRAFGRA